MNTPITQPRPLADHRRILKDRLTTATIAHSAALREGDTELARVTGARAAALSKQLSDLLATEAAG